ncbi:MAG: GGDEF domain-containing protein [Psychrobacter sp.]|nr:GGDEF domain-containing protein [Psychrobacter sp.]
MTTPTYQLGYKKLSKIIFEWHAADKASLLALFITIEVTTHWLWCFLAWIRQDAINDYVHMHLLYPLWLGITVAAVFFWWMIGKLACIKDNKKDLYKWQLFLIVPYTIYLTIIIVMMGYSSLFAGVSLVGGAVLSMMLVKRQYVWYMFLTQIALILLAIISPYSGIILPNLRQLTVTYPMPDTFSYLSYNEIMVIENAIAAVFYNSEALGWDGFNQIQHSSTFFWRLTHIYLALPKAIFIVYAFRTLLLILDDSKREIVQHANQDELTTLYNRRYSLTQMQQTLEVLPDNQDYSVILLDLDFFKDINDNYGHQVGDQVLREVAFILKNTLDFDSVSRYGGEEFLIILPDTTHKEAMTIAETLRDNIGDHVVKTCNNSNLQVTASLGLYTFDAAERNRVKQEFAETMTQVTTQKRRTVPLFRLRSTETVQATEAQLLPDGICQRLISLADEALYVAKARNRNQVVSANELMDVQAMTAPRYGT